ncbi:hypothetical protein Tco_0663826 [Tanacetum coccineum]
MNPNNPNTPWTTGILNDPQNQIPGSSSANLNLNFTNSNPYVNPDHQILFQQWQLQQQMFNTNISQQQSGNSQQQSEAETQQEAEDETIPTSSSKKPRSRGKRDPRIGSDKKNDTFWYKILDAYNDQAGKRGFPIRTKNMLTGKWTPMNREVSKFNSLVNETNAMSGENDDDLMTRIEILYRAREKSDFNHKSAWNFFKGKHKWNNPESINARRNRHRLTNNEPELFGDDELPRPAGLHRIAKTQRSSNSTASSGPNPQMFQEMIQQQYELDRKEKMERIDR